VLFRSESGDRERIKRIEKECEFLCLNFGSNGMNEVAASAHEVSPSILHCIPCILW